MNTEELARQAGINTKFWNMGAGSVLFVSFVDGIPRSNFEDFCNAFQCEVLEQAAKSADELDCAHRCSVGSEVGKAIRAMKPTKDQS